MMILNGWTPMGTVTMTMPIQQQTGTIAQRSGATPQLTYRAVLTPMGMVFQIQTTLGLTTQRGLLIRMVMALQTAMMIVQPSGVTLLKSSKVVLMLTAMDGLPMMMPSLMMAHNGMTQMAMDLEMNQQAITPTIVQQRLVIRGKMEHWVVLMLMVMAGQILKTALTTTKLNGRIATGTDSVTILEELIQIVVQVMQEILPKVEY